ncbi:hypothetical protein HY489_01890 [Candidatus Woesearchaeota archaeon]|nr:hypothetical protein [Candidatus Woesearchaeota archaeon]
MNIDKEVFELWKEVAPEEAFSAGLKEFAGKIWIPSHQNIKVALKRVGELKKLADPVASKWLHSLERSLVWDEPQHPPGSVMNVFFNHLTIEGVKEQHVLDLAVQCVNLLGVQEDMWDRKWPVELQIFSAQSCDGAVSLLESMRKQCRKKETKDAVVALQKRLKLWKEKTCFVKLKRNDFKEIFPILQKKSKGLGRKNMYRSVIKDWYDYIESAEEIEQLALKWIDEELPEFNASMMRLSKRYKCKPEVDAINKMLTKEQSIPLKSLVKTTKDLRKVLQKLAEQEWVNITRKYDVRVIETPDYLVPFLPTAAMQSFNSLTKPFCLSFVTTDKNASPSTFLPGVIQTLIHEEYGHCVNFMNSYSNKDLRVLEILDSSLSTPLTEGISFFRELESLKTFERMARSGPKNKVEKDVIKLVEKFCPFDAFVEGISFEVMQWRMVRFLRAVSDVRLNLEKQSFPEFIKWAHEKTGLSEKLVFDQTFHFQENPGYAPCYSVFGQRLRELQAAAVRNGFSQVDFNTFVASAGFPARSLFEGKIKQKFTL